MKTPEEYTLSLKELGPEVYVRGKRVDVTDEPSLRPGLNAVKSTYEYAQKTEHKDLFTVKSHITGNEINIFCHIPQNSDDLFDWINAMRLLGRELVVL